MFKITSEFEAEVVTDYFLIPWWFTRYYLTWLIWKMARGFNRLRYWKKRNNPFYPLLIEPGHGRHTDIEPYCCERCLWSGPYRWLVHAYCDDGMGDVEPVDECPRCGLS